MASVEQLIREYLQTAKMLQLATSVSDQPWVCNVWFAVDEKLDIFWFSSTNRRHSREVEQNPNVAGAIVLPLTPADPARGVQFEGTASKLTDLADIHKARSVYQDRIFPAQTIDSLMANPQKPHVFYRVKVSTYVLFDTLNFPDDSRQEWVRV